VVVVAAVVGACGGGVETATVTVPDKSFLPVIATLAALTAKLDAIRLALEVETLFVTFELIGDDEEDNDEEDVDDDDGNDDVVVLNFNTL
jgi:hypothetical protein